MNISHFIGASSALLLAWLGITYFHKVPFERYPNQSKFNSASVPVETNADAGMMAENDSAPATKP